jgi:integrase
LVIASGRVTVAAYATTWLAREGEKSAAGRGLAESTVDFYRQVFEYYVNPLVGSRPLPDLTTEDVEQMMTELARAGRKPRTVQAARNALGRLLKDAKRHGLVADVATIGSSQVRRALADDDGPESKALTPEQLRSLFEAAAGTTWEPLIATMGLLGLRRGEALGLSWSDLDLDARKVTVRRSLSRVRSRGATHLVLAPTKTRNSRRPLPLPALLVNLLRSWRAEQTRQRLRVGENWGHGWLEDDLVFTTPIGMPVDPDNLRHALQRLGRSAGVGHVHPHQLRHTLASVMIASGHTPPEVAKVLGHSSPAVTLEYYAHAFDDASIRAINAMAQALTNP